MRVELERIGWMPRGAVMRLALAIVLIGIAAAGAFGATTASANQNAELPSPPTVESIETAAWEDDAGKYAVRVEWEPNGAEDSIEDFTIARRYAGDVWKTKNVTGEHHLYKGGKSAGLKYGAEFHFRIRANSAAGAGEWSHIHKIVVGKPNAPPAPIKLTGASGTRWSEYGIELRWRNVDGWRNLRKLIQGYQVKYRQANGDKNDWKIVKRFDEWDNYTNFFPEQRPDDASAMTRLHADDLLDSAGKGYGEVFQIRVRATSENIYKDDIEYGPWSDIIEVAYLTPPQIVSLSLLEPGGAEENSGIHVQWDTKIHDYDGISGNVKDERYRVEVRDQSKKGKSKRVSTDKEQIEVRNLEQGKSYRVRVRTEYGTGASAVRSKWSSWSRAITIPVSPIRVSMSPSGDYILAAGEDLKVTFTANIPEGQSLTRPFIIKYLVLPSARISGSDEPISGLRTFKLEKEGQTSVTITLQTYEGGEFGVYLLVPSSSGSSLQVKPKR